MVYIYNLNGNITRAVKQHTPQSNTWYKATRIAKQQRLEASKKEDGIQRV